MYAGARQPRVTALEAMFGVRTIVIGLGLVLLTYAALSAWPAVQALMNPEPLEPQPLLLAGAAPAPATLPRAIPQRPLPGSAVAAQPPQSGRPQPRLIADLSRGGGMSVANWDSEKVRYAVESVVLHTKPGGTPLQPTSLNRAPLTVLSGTRLLPVKEHGNWVLVSSPSSMLGWVRKSELANKPPRAREKRWK